MLFGPRIGLLILAKRVIVNLPLSFRIIHATDIDQDVAFCMTTTSWIGWSMAGEDLRTT